MSSSQASRLSYIRQRLIVLGILLTTIIASVGAIQYSAVNNQPNDRFSILSLFVLENTTWTLPSGRISVPADVSFENMSVAISNFEGQLMYYKLELKIATSISQISTTAPLTGKDVRNIKPETQYEIVLSPSTNPEEDAWSPLSGSFSWGPSILRFTINDTVRNDLSLSSGSYFWIVVELWHMSSTAPLKTSGNQSYVTPQFEYSGLYVSLDAVLV